MAESGICAAGAIQHSLIGEMLMLAAGERVKGAWSCELMVYGIKLLPLGAVKFKISELDTAFRRCSGAHPKMDKSDRFGTGNPVRYVAKSMQIDPPVRPLDPATLS